MDDAAGVSELQPLADRLADLDDYTLVVCRGATLVPSALVDIGVHLKTFLYKLR